MRERGQPCPGHDLGNALEVDVGEDSGQVPAIGQLAAGIIPARGHAEVEILGRAGDVEVACERSPLIEGPESNLLAREGARFEETVTIAVEPLEPRAHLIEGPRLRGGSR